MLLTLLLLQAAAEPLPDIEFRATVRARSLKIEKKGEARLTVTTDPPGRDLVDIQAPRADGSSTISNPVIVVDVKARIADPAPGAPPAQPPR